MDTRGLSRWPLLAAALLAPPGLLAAPALGADNTASFTNSIEQEQDSKLLLNSIRNDLAAYISNAALLNPDTYSYYLSLPQKLALSTNISFDSSSSAFTKGTIGNLAMIGTAGYILSFLPKGAFEAITNLVPPPPELLVPPPPELLEPAKLFQNPYTEENNPVSDLKEHLPKLPLRREEAAVAELPRSGYSANRQRDWHRMDTFPPADLDTSDSEPEVEARKDAEDVGFLASLGKSIASLFDPISRASEGVGLTGLLSTFANFWEDNFAWGSGKYSPKVMIERQSRHQEGREGELLLEEESEQKLSVIDAGEDMDDYKEYTDYEREDQQPLMSARMRPPPPLKYHML